MLFLRNRRKLVPDEIYDCTLQITQLMEEGEKRTEDLKTAGCTTVAHSDFLNLCVSSAQLDTYNKQPFFGHSDSLVFAIINGIF